jgi:DNA-binding MarR family transcriptional regulator
MTDPVDLAQAIGRASGLMAALEAQAFADERYAELSLRQMYYLSAIIRLERPTFSGLARELKVTKPSVTSIVGTLIGKGYVRKVRDDEDQRIYHIVLTPKAVAFSRIHADIHKRLADVLAAQLEEREVAQLARLLDKALPVPKR